MFAVVNAPLTLAVTLSIPLTVTLIVTVSVNVTPTVTLTLTIATTVTVSVPHAVAVTPFVLVTPQPIARCRAVSSNRVMCVRCIRRSRSRCVFHIVIVRIRSIVSGIRRRCRSRRSLLSGSCGLWAGYDGEGGFIVTRAMMLFMTMWMIALVTIMILTTSMRATRTIAIMMASMQGIRRVRIDIRRVLICVFVLSLLFVLLRMFVLLLSLLLLLLSSYVCLSTSLVVYVLASRIRIACHIRL